MQGFIILFQIFCKQTALQYYLKVSAAAYGLISKLALFKTTLPVSFNQFLTGCLFSKLYLCALNFNFSYDSTNCDRS